MYGKVYVQCTEVDSTIEIGTGSQFNSRHASAVPILV